MTPPQVLIVRNPEDALVLVHDGKTVLKATSPWYVGQSLARARCAALSVMRWWNPTILDMDYPEEVACPSP